MKPLLPVLVAAIVVAAGTACSGDDDPADPAAATDAEATFTLTGQTTDDTAAQTEAAEAGPESAPVQSAWAREVDSACRSSQERLDALEPPAGTSIEDFMAEAVPLMREQIEAVEAVDVRPGSAEARSAAQLVAEMRGVEAGLRRYADALRANDGAAAQAALLEAGTAGAEARRRASALGLTACGGFAGG